MQEDHIDKHRELKREYKEQSFKDSFKKQFSTARIDIINALINARADFEKAKKTGLYRNEPIFNLYRSLYRRSDCRGLKI